MNIKNKMTFKLILSHYFLVQTVIAVVCGHCCIQYQFNVGGDVTKRSQRACIDGYYSNVINGQFCITM